jgi:hypothetical protein
MDTQKTEGLEKKINQMGVFLQHLLQVMGEREDTHTRIVIGDES